MTYYSFADQDRHYREAARDRGCVCPDLPAHVHNVECPMYQVASVPTMLHDHQDSPAAATDPFVESGRASPPVPPLAEPAGQGETTLGEGEVATSATSPSAGDRRMRLRDVLWDAYPWTRLFLAGRDDDYSVHLDQEHDADWELVSLFEREEDHAADRYWGSRDR